MTLRGIPCPQTSLYGQAVQRPLQWLAEVGIIPGPVLSREGGLLLAKNGGYRPQLSDIQATAQQGGCLRGRKLGAEGRAGLRAMLFLPH